MSGSSTSGTQVRNGLDSGGQAVWSKVLEVYGTYFGGGGGWNVDGEKINSAFLILEILKSNREGPEDWLIL